jgi:hypothetical protein
MNPTTTEICFLLRTVILSEAKDLWITDEPGAKNRDVSLGST